MSAVAAGASSGGAAPSGAPSSAPASEAPSSSSERVQDIFEAVDGAGVKPSIPTIEERKKKNVPKKQTPGNNLSAVAGESSDSSADPLAEVEKFINQELSPGEQEIADRVGDENTPDQQDQSRGEKRFQDLANARRVAEERASAFEQHNQKLTQQFGQFQEQVGQAFQQMQLRNERLMGIVETLQRGVQPTEEEMDPETRVLSRLTDASVEKLSPMMRKLVEPLQQELAAYKQRDSERESLARSTENKNKYLSDADSFTVNTVLKGVPEEFVTPQHREDYKSDVLSTMYAYRTNAENAAKIVREKNLRNALLFIKAFGKSKRGAQEAGAAAPPVSGRGVGNSNAANTSSQKPPSMDLLAKHGFRGDTAILDWAFAGSPALV